MDIVAHTLWAAAGATVLNRPRQLSRSTVIATLVLAALRDVLHLLPIAGEWLMFHRHILEHGDVGMMGQFIAVYRTPLGVGRQVVSRHTAMQRTPCGGFLPRPQHPLDRRRNRPLLHTWSGASGVKSRARRFDTTGRSFRLSAVTTNCLLPRARMPCG